MSPDSNSFIKGGCAIALAVTWPVLPGPRNSFFPPGRGTLNGFGVLFVIFIGGVGTLTRAWAESSVRRPQAISISACVSSVPFLAEFDEQFIGLIPIRLIRQGGGGEMVTHGGEHGFGLID